MNKANTFWGKFGHLLYACGVDLRSAADSLIDWMYNHGQVDKLATLVTNTAGARSLVLSLASMAAAHGFIHASLPESAVSVAVLLLTWLVNEFVQYARNRHSAEVQRIAIDAGVTLKEDDFIGRRTVAALKDAVNAAPPVPPLP